MKPTSRKQTNVEEDGELSDTAIGSDDDLANRSPDENLQEFFTRFPDLHTITISRLDDGRWQYLATAAHDVVSEEYIQRRFKGGHYRLQLRSPKGFLGKKTQIHIADPVDTERSTPTPPAGPQAMDLYSVLQAQNQRQHEMILAMINRDRPAGMGLTEILPLVKLMQGSQQTSLADQLETLKSLKELTGDGGDGGDFMKEIRGLLMPLLVAKLAGRTAGKQTQPAGDEGIDMEMQAVIVKAIQTVKPAAQAGADPIMMARLAIQYAHRDPDTLDFLADLAEQRFPAALAMLGQYDPELTREPLASWLGIFHEALNDELHGAPNTERNRGNAGDPARHGAPGGRGSTGTDNAGGLDGPTRQIG